MNAGYFRTWYGNFLATRNLLVNPATDYDEYCITVPADSRLPNSGECLCGLYDLKPAKFGQRDNLVTQAANFGERTQVFNGVDVLQLQRQFGPTYLDAQQVMGGRLLKIGAQLDFYSAVEASIRQVGLDARRASPSTASLSRGPRTSVHRREEDP